MILSSDSQNDVVAHWLRSVSSAAWLGSILETLHRSERLEYFPLSAKQQKNNVEGYVGKKMEHYPVPRDSFTCKFNNDLESILQNFLTNEVDSELSTFYSFDITEKLDIFAVVVATFTLSVRMMEDGDFVKEEVIEILEKSSFYDSNELAMYSALFTWCQQALKNRLCIPKDFDTFIGSVGLDPYFSEYCKNLKNWYGEDFTYGKISEELKKEIEKIENVDLQGLAKSLWYFYRIMVGQSFIVNEEYFAVVPSQMFVELVANHEDLQILFTVFAFLVALSEDSPSSEVYDLIIPSRLIYDKHPMRGLLQEFFRVF